MLLVVAMWVFVLGRRALGFGDVLLLFWFSDGLAGAAGCVCGVLRCFGWA